MSNALIVSNLVSKKMTEFMERSNVIRLTANNDYQQEFTQQMYATGANVDIKIPGYAAVQRGLATTASDIEDLVVSYPIVENDIYSVVRNLNLFEQKFDLLGGTGALTNIVKRAIVDNLAYPAFEAIETQIEITAALRMKLGAFLSPIDSIAKLTSINTYSAVREVQTLMNVLKLPKMDRTFMMNEYDYAAVGTSLTNNFNTDVSKPLLRSGRFMPKMLAGFNMTSSPDFTYHTAGTSALRTGVTVSALDATGTLLTLTGLASSSGVLFLAGDRIAIPAVKLIANVSGAVLTTGLVVTVAANANGDGAGNCQVTLSFPLMASGEHANVSALPANGNAVEIFPSYNVNYAYTRSGLSSVALPLGRIEGATNSDESPGGFPIKVNVQGSVSAYSNIFRISALQATKVIPPYIITVPSAA